MPSLTPDAGSQAQRALNDLCCARKLSLGLLVVTMLFTVGAVVSARMSGESIWQTAPAPLSSVAVSIVLWMSCQQRIRAKQRELQQAPA